MAHETDTTALQNELRALRRQVNELKRQTAEREGAEEALRSARKQLDLALNAINDGVWDWDVASGEVRRSPGWYRMLGYDLDALPPTVGTWDDNIHPDDYSRVMKAFAAHLEGHAPIYEAEYRFRTRDGGWKWILDRARVVEWDADGKPTRMVGAHHDIDTRRRAEETLRRAKNELEQRVQARTAQLASMNEHLLVEIDERRRTEEALKESESRFRTVFDWSPEPMALTDVTTGRLVDVNERFAEITRMGKHELIGRTTTEHGFYNQFDRNRFLRELMRTGQVQGLEMGFRLKDGTVANALMYARLLTIVGRQMILSLFVDVTDQRKLEAHLRQAQKMEAVGTLAGGIAHDFNNILTAIIGYSELALSDLPGEAPARASIRQVLQAGQRARNLVQQILRFSRRSEQERTAVQLGPIVKEALKLLRASLPTTIEIQVDVEETGGLVLADPTQIHQILMNMCANAAHAMKAKGGLLRVSLKSVTVTEEKSPGAAELAPGPYLKLTVGDTGQGIDPTILDRIFEPFFTTKAPGEGTGMGLSVVHGVVLSHGGAVTVRSEPGQGTTFDVFFPEMKEGEPLPSVMDVTRMPGGNERILFVDDEDVLTDLGRQVLEHLGYRVVTANSGQEALKIFSERLDGFDLVITDQTMPRMTGIELAEDLLRLRPDLPIILCTGFSQQVTAEMALQQGVRRFLMKPLVPREVAQVIRAVLEE